MFDYFNHTYTFNATGIRMRERKFASREAANRAMYKFMAKHHLSLIEVYDDKHYKTYICNNDVRFYIHRSY